MCDRQQRLIGSLRVDLVGLRIRCGDGAAVAVEDERGAGFSDLELRQKPRQPRVFDENGKNAFALCIDVDRAGKGDRGTRADGVIGDIEPARIFGLDAVAVPILLEDGVGGVLEPAAFELDVAHDGFVLIDPALDLALDQIDFHHLDAGIAELVGGEERIVRPAERDPRNRRLRLQLGQEDEFALVRFAGFKNVLQKQGADRGMRGSRLGGDGGELRGDRRYDLRVDGGGKHPAGCLGRPEPQHVGADRGHDDRSQHQT